jgi:hypothetical protein
VIYVFTDEEENLKRQLPPLLCSPISNLKEIYGDTFDHSQLECNVRFARPEVREQLLSPSNTDYSGCAVENGVALSSIYAFNPWHAFFENLLPLFGLLTEGLGLSLDPSRSVDELKKNGGGSSGVMSWGLMHMPLGDLGFDYGLGGSMFHKMLREFLPEVELVGAMGETHLPGYTCAVKKLVAGSRGNCIHWKLCKPATYSPSDLGVQFRAFGLHRFGLSPRDLDSSCSAAAAADDDDVPSTCGAPSSSGQQRSPRVTIVQRSKSRTIGNIAELQAAVLRRTGAQSAQVLDFSTLTVREQVSVVHATDVLILAHGAALMNVMWLPQGSLIVDIRPYAYESDGGLIDAVLSALLPLSFVHAPFHIRNSTGQVLELPSSIGVLRELPKNCSCPAIEPVGEFYFCGMNVYWSTRTMLVDIPAFEEHLEDAMEKWRRGALTVPLSPQEYNEAMLRRNREQEGAEGLGCWAALQEQQQKDL